MAERTGLEPATPGVTGRYSNRLNYRSALRNRDYTTPTRLSPRCITRDLTHYCRGDYLGKMVVGAERFELPTYAL